MDLGSQDSFDLGTQMIAAFDWVQLQTMPINSNEMELWVMIQSICSAIVEVDMIHLQK